MRKRINIIGCGRAAGSLARLWMEAGSVAIGDVLNRTGTSTSQAVTRLGAGTAAKNVQTMAAADYWLIGTGDHQVPVAAGLIADQVRDVGEVLVFHLAGRFGLDVLAPVEGSGAFLAALHPVRSLSGAALSLSDFEGTACVAEGSADALKALRPLVASIGGIWLPVGEIDRGLYHASVSIISNITKAVAWKAQNWLEKSGLEAETAAAVTHQLLHSTMEDLFRSGASQSITGPVVRGDTRTIEAHLSALKATYPDDVDVYRVLARTVLELAQVRGDLDQATLDKFKILFKS
jgi:predicted short-subunit dehydrogenase-like oxidoreductase (DUF2520 family)